jgi:DNA-binding transcriptional ArsR family regulator
MTTSPTTPTAPTAHTKSHAARPALPTAPDPPTPIDPEAVAEVRAEAPAEELLALVVEAFGALADPTRARILYALIRRPLCVRDLAIVAGVSESAASHQLRLLRGRRLVKPRRQGNIIYYSVDDHHVAALFREAEYHADHVQQARPDHPYP